MERWKGWRETYKMVRKEKEREAGETDEEKREKSKAAHLTQSNHIHSHHVQSV